MNNRHKSTMLEEFNLIRQIYHARGFKIREVKADLEFECLAVDILPVTMDLVAKDDHVGEIERANRTTKEDLRVLTHGLPYRRWTREMVKEGVRFVIKNRNQFPVEDGISKVLSPATIVVGAHPPDCTKMLLEFGAYEAFNEKKPTNTMESRATGAIALTNIGNSKGDYYFMSVETGERITRQQWTELPLPKEIISQVEYLALKEKQPLLKAQELLFEKRPGVPISDEELKRKQLKVLLSDAFLVMTRRMKVMIPMPRLKRRGD